MIIRVPILLLGAVLVSTLSACGGSNQFERTSSAKGIIAVKPVSSCGQAGSNSVIYFYDDGSSSTSGPIVKYEWNFGAGWEDFSSTGGLASHFYDTPGTQNTHLRVTDSTGQKASGKVKVMIVEGFDAQVVRLLWGVDEGDEYRQSSDGSRLRYHNWRWRCLSYDPETPTYTENHILAIAIGDPDFDLLRVYSAGSTKDYVMPDLDDDGVNDDPSIKRVLILPHVLEVSGSCIGRGKEDVYVWKVKPVGANGEGKKEYVGHVTLLK